MSVMGIIGAMDSEVTNLIERMEDSKTESVAGRTFFTGRLSNHPVIVVKSGIGKVSAAATAQLLADRFGVDGLINTGMAGGLDSRLAVKDLVVGSYALHHDFDLTPLGYVKGCLAGAEKQHPTLFASDPTLTEAALQAAQQVLPAGSKAITGIIASGDIFVDDSALKKSIVDTFHAAATDMESAAIAQVATENGVPFLVLRTISDLAEHQANVSLDELEEYVGRLAGDITVKMLEILSQSHSIG